MAQLKFTLKRNNSGVYDELFPKTIIAQVDGLQTALDNKLDDTQLGAANGVASLDSNGLIPASQLGTYIRGGIKILGTMGQAANDTVGELIGILEALVSTNQPREELVGYAFVAAAGFTLSQGTLPTNTAFSVVAGDEGDSTVPITFEAGDILLVSNYSFSSPTHTYTFAAINNNYSLASTGAPGIVTLGQFATAQDLSGNEVITGSGLSGLLLGGDQNGAVTNLIALSGHTHSQYQPVDADLTALAGLSTADGNFIVGNGSTWVAESGSTARASLGLAINTDVQAYDAGLASIAGLNPVADRYLYTTGTDTFAAGTITSFARGLLDDADAATARTTLGLAIGTNVQAYDPDLAAIAALTPTDNNIIVGNGTAWVAESGSTARTSLGLAINTDVQAYSARLADIAALAVTDGNIIVGNGTTWVAESNSTARASLGVYSTSEVDAFFTNRPEIYYNTTTGAGNTDLIIADVVSV